MSKKFTLVLLSLILIISCSDNEENCDRSEWIGTFKKNMHSCLINVFWEDTLTISEGECDNCLIDNLGRQYVLDSSCKVATLQSADRKIVLWINDGTIKATIYASDCLFIFEKI